MNNNNFEGLSLVPVEQEVTGKAEEPDQEILAIVNKITELSKEPQTEENKIKLIRLQIEKERLIAEKQIKQDEKYLIKKPTVTNNGYFPEGYEGGANKGARA